MAYLNNSKFREIREAAKAGNEKAAMILQAMIKGKQEDVDRLVEGYYHVEEPPLIVEEEIEVAPAKPVQPEANSIPEVEDLTEVLDGELDGVIDREDIKDLSFQDFLNNKHTDGLRARKSAEYFKAYDPAGRGAYLDKKKVEYRDSFNPRLKDIDRQYRDLDRSLSKYSQSVGDMLDDDKELDMTTAISAYDELTKDHDSMLGLGRSHDEDDYNAMVEKLHRLVEQYGKKNVQAALNTLKSDNEAYKTFRNGQINNEVERYSKSLEKLLK